MAENTSGISQQPQTHSPSQPYPTHQSGNTTGTAGVASHQVIPPYHPHYHSHAPHYQPQPAQSSGCGKMAIGVLITLFILGFLGIVILIGSVYLFSIASNAFDEISAEIEMREETVTEKFIVGNRQSENIIAVLTISGIITSEEDGFIARQIRKVSSDSRVKAVVLRVDSPGGTMTGSDYYLHMLKKMKSERNIPVVVSMGSIAASGGYFVSMVGDEIYAEPSTITGSIGVIASLFDASQFFDKIGVESTPITSGKHKAMGSFMKPMSEEERVIWQNLIDENFNRFKQIIREGREEFASDPDKLDALATGQVYTASEAVTHQLIDKIGFLDNAIDRAHRLAGLEKSDYKVLRYKPKASFLRALTESRSSSTWMGSDVLSQMTTPKIYLICPYTVPVDGN